MSFVIGIGLACVLLALGSAGFFMLRKDNKDGQARDKRMARALAVRVGLSVALFLFVLVSYELGWIHPTGLPIGK